MKINFLHIDNHKLLKEFSIDFEKDISILIGINGSGKSTILESIAQTLIQPPPFWHHQLQFSSFLPPFCAAPRPL